MQIRIIESNPWRINGKQILNIYICVFKEIYIHSYYFDKDYHMSTIIYLSLI